MKLPFLTLLVLILASRGYSQYNQILEQKKGFKEFIIGDSIIQYYAITDFSSFKDGEEKRKYLGKCCSTILNYDVKQIDLYFRNNILITIKITLFPIGKDLEKATSILSNFASSFGKADDIRKGTDGNTLYTAMWLSKSVNMALAFKYFNVKDGYLPEVFILNSSKNDKLDF